jgi:predicted AAA+ superfamily ATPase
VRALRSLEQYFGRVRSIWKPVSTEESFEIVRRRLFKNISNESARDAVCRHFIDYYINNKNAFPPEMLDNRYFERMQKAYPVHPEFFDRLFEDWSTLENFQRTRGVLRLMAMIIHRLWKDGNENYLITPGCIPLYDHAVGNEMVKYLPAGWEAVLEI